METESTPPAGLSRRRGKTIGLVVGGAIAGAIAVSAVGAAASSSGNSGIAGTGTPGSTNASESSTDTDYRHGRGAGPARGDEKALSASQTATLKAAALKAVPGGTVYRVETDAGDGVYEAHMTKADGTEVTVKFDKNLKVTKVESGMGTGDPHGHR